MKTTAIDLEFVPSYAFSNVPGLMWLVDTIHAQWQEFMAGGEDSGWAGDAGYGPISVILPRFKHFIAVAGTDLVFGFADDCDRDCVLTDYLGDEGLIPATLKDGEYGSAMIQPKSAKKES